MLRRLSDAAGPAHPALPAEAGTGAPTGTSRVAGGELIPRLAQGGSATGAALGSGLTSREWDALVDEVARRIEDRIVVELARRGRRFTPRMM